MYINVAEKSILRNLSPITAKRTYEIFIDTNEIMKRRIIQFFSVRTPWGPGSRFWPDFFFYFFTCSWKYFDISYIPGGQTMYECYSVISWEIGTDISFSCLEPHPAIVPSFTGAQCRVLSAITASCLLWSSLITLCGHQFAPLGNSSCLSYLPTFLGCCCSHLNTCPRVPLGPWFPQEGRGVATG